MRQTLLKVKNPKKYDFTILVIIALMFFISVISIYSAFEVIITESPTVLLLKQIMWYTFGFITLSFLLYLGNDTIYTIAKFGYWIIMLMLIYLFIDRYFISKFLGSTTHLPFITPINGATSWFILPFGSFQPSEFMKVFLIFITAHIIDEHNNVKIVDSYESDLNLFGKVMKWAIPPMVLIFLQPDTGICIIIFISLATMIMCSGIKKFWIILGFSIILLSIGIFFYFYFFNKSALISLIGIENSYKIDRITGWLNPEADKLKTGNQLYTALLAMGSAGLTGHGIQEYIVNIPEAQTDFIFAIIAQTFGLLGSIFVVLLCVIFDILLIKIALQTKVMRDKYFISGVIGMLLFQQIENIGMIIGIFPITGITLPFISYGGSSLLSYFILLSSIMISSGKAKKLSDFVYD